LLLLSVVLFHLFVTAPELRVIDFSRAMARPTAQPTAKSPIDDWLTKPTVIVLTKEQEARIDTVKTNYGIEAKAVADALRTADEMTIMVRTRDFHGKYLDLVRQVLRPEQRAVFDKNIPAQKFTLPKPPR
jgi:hypothetical protein